MKYYRINLHLEKEDKSIVILLVVGGHFTKLLGSYKGHHLFSCVKKFLNSNRIIKLLFQEHNEFLWGITCENGCI